ncbi:tyrosine-type recombinase/integrase, partial [Terrabacter terrigena]
LGTVGYRSSHSTPPEALMSSYETRTNPKTGNVAHRIRFRIGTQNRAVTFTTEAAARSWQGVLDSLGPGKALALLTEEKTPTTTRTVADQVDHHVEHLTGIDEGTRRRYRNIARDKLRPHFDKILLSDLTRDHVAAWVNKVRLDDGTPPSAKTLRNWHGLLSAALSSAVDAGLTPTNPAYRLRLPRVDHDADEMIFLSQPEVAQVLRLLDPHWRPLVLLLVLTGVRWGEATALQVKDIDVADHSARIRRAWKHTEGEGMRLGPPKSQRSRRTVAIPPLAMDAIVPLLQGKAPDEFVILNKAGRPVRSGTFHGRVWQPMVHRFAGDEVATETDTRGRPRQRVVARGPGKHPRIHDLRHTYASWAIQDRVQLPVIQRQMGHESITTTIDRYVHLVRDDYVQLLSVGQGLGEAITPAFEAAS